MFITKLYARTHVAHTRDNISYEQSLKPSYFISFFTFRHSFPLGQLPLILPIYIKIDTDRKHKYIYIIIECSKNKTKK